MNRATTQSSHASRLRVVSRMKGAERAGVGTLDLLAFAVPAVSFAEIATLGRLIVSEILMIAMLPWLWGAWDRRPCPQPRSGGPAVGQGNARNLRSAPDHPGGDA